MAKRWYVVHAYSGFEKNVARALKERIGLSKLEEYFGQVLVPTEEVVEMRAGQKRRSERKFFPGYVLVEMELNDETWHLVKETPRVMGFIGGKADRPAPLTENEAKAILDRVESGGDKATPKTIYEPGELVRVTDGPFNDFNGVVEQRELREEPSGGGASRSSDARRRWNSTSRRWRKVDLSTSRNAKVDAKTGLSNPVEGSAIA